MTAPTWKRSLPPEVVAIDVTVGEVHGALVGLVLVLARNVRHHGEAPRDDGPLGAAQGREIGFGHVRIKIVDSERAPADEHFYAICPSIELDGRSEGMLARARGQQGQ